MKRTVFLFVWMSSTLFCLGQAPKAGVQLIYEYINVGLSERRSVTLSYRDQESISSLSGKDSIKGGDTGDFNISGEDKTGRQVYKNTRTKEVVFRDYVPEGGDFNPCIVSDPMKPMSWKFSGETKVIGKYVCKSASTEFRGRKYVAFYTEDIPISHGPWKFSGLPGGIVEVYSLDRNISFSLVRMSTAAMEIKKPSSGKVITMSYYATRHEKATGEFIDRLRAALPRGATLTDNSSGDYNLETDYSDVER